MKHRTLAMTTGFEEYTKKTRRAQFLEEMEQVVPWVELCALVDPLVERRRIQRRGDQFELAAGFTV
jgi:hypothetical protein